MASTGVVKLLLSDSFVPPVAAVHHSMSTEGALGVAVSVVEPDTHKVVVPVMVGAVGPDPETDTVTAVDVLVQLPLRLLLVTVNVPDAPTVIDCVVADVLQR